jgi:hypothetical protein
MTMSNDSPEALPTGALSKEIASEIRLLAKAQIDLAEVELRADLKREVVTITGLGVAAVAALMPVSLLLVAAVFALSSILPGWVASLIVSGFVLLVAVTAGVIGSSKRVRTPAVTGVLVRRLAQRLIAPDRPRRYVMNESMGARRFAAASLLLLPLLAPAGCAHQKAPSTASDAAKPTVVAAPAKDTQPGARPDERDRLLEAQWKEVAVKASISDGDVVSAVKLTQPKIRVFHAGSPPAKKDSPPPTPDKDKPAAKHPTQTIDLAQEMRKLTPLDVDHIDILDGQVAFVDTSRKERPELWLHDLQLSVENLTTRVRMTEGRPVLLTATATLQHSGRVAIFITADPFEKGLTFSGRAAIVGLQTSELYRFIEPVANMHAPHGTIDLFVEFDCRNGELTGGVKPVLKNVEIRADDKNLWTALKAWATDLAVELFSDRVKDRNAVATVIPIKGTLNGPNVELWPAIFGVLRNAFVEGLTSGYAHLPPPR